ncbi:MAG: hypothetical protein HY807_01505 [Nitrospirae bacterium]|nr:hypothetical protein [Nitrospirota bacterium]
MKKKVNYATKLNFLKLASLYSILIGSLGAGIGGYISVIEDNFLYAGLGSAIGGVIGWTVAFICYKHSILVPNKPELIESRITFFIGVAGIFIALICLAGFIFIRDIRLLIGIVFFGSIGIYLFYISKRLHSGDHFKKLEEASNNEKTNKDYYA